jgi:hypothetical protein
MIYLHITLIKWYWAKLVYVCDTLKIEMEKTKVVLTIPVCAYLNLIENSTGISNTVSS